MATDLRIDNHSHTLWGVAHLVDELLGTMKSLFDSALIQAIGPLEHPNYSALGK